MLFCRNCQSAFTELTQTSWDSHTFIFSCLTEGCYAPLLQPWAATAQFLPSCGDVLICADRPPHHPLPPWPEAWNLTCLININVYIYPPRDNHTQQPTVTFTVYFNVKHLKRVSDCCDSSGFCDCLFFSRNWHEASTLWNWPDSILLWFGTKTSSSKGCTYLNMPPASKHPNKHHRKFFNHLTLV